MARFMDAHNGFVGVTAVLLVREKAGHLAEEIYELPAEVD